MAEQHHKILLPDNVTKTYKKAPPNLETSINVEAKNIAELINPDDHIVCIAKTAAFITLKDHRLEFQQLEFPANLVIFNGEILNGKLHFLCTDHVFQL